MEDVDRSKPQDFNNENHDPITPSTKKNHWSLLRNVVRAVTLFKTHEAHEYDDVSELIDEIKQIPTDNIYRLRQNRTRENSAYTVAIKDLRRQQSMMRCVERGNPSDLDQIKIEIDQDPYKLLRNNTHPLALINKRNMDGHTPLYVACKNGNLEVVILLIKEKADYLMTSIVEKEEEETNLEVAIRWGHMRIASELLKLEWPKDVLNKARKLARTPEMIALFKKSSKPTWCFCFCSKNNSK